MVKGHDVTERLRSKHSIHKRGVNVCEYVSERESVCVCVLKIQHPPPCTYSLSLEEQSLYALREK